MIYLDHASTSFPKPPEVLAAVQRWFTELGVSPDRGDSERCAEVERVVEDTRAQLGRMCGVDALRVAFTSGATESINLFLRGFLRPGDRVLTTALEHSSVVRPLLALRDELGLELEVARPDAAGYLDPADIAARCAAQRPRLLVFSHASNVLGSVQDAAALCAIARRAGCATLLDASQTAGALPIDVGADAIAASAHKALLGPPGLGFLAVRDDVAVRTTKFGGTGSAAALDRHPDAWPAALQAGTLNLPAIFGLGAALCWLTARGDEPYHHALRQLDAGRAGLAAGRATLLGPAPGAGRRVPILSFTRPDFDPAELGLLLSEAGVHVRTGFHCAPWLHELLGTQVGGTVRISTGPFTGDGDVAAAVAALR